MFKTYVLNLVSFFIFTLLWLGSSVLLAKPYYIGGGLGYASDYFNQSYVPLLGVGLGRGAANEEIRRYNAFEDDVAEKSSGTVNPSYEAGGCPDIHYFLDETVELSTEPINYIDPQVIDVNGRNCLVSSSSGKSIGINALEFDFMAQYEYLPWLFFRTGITAGIVFQVSYSLGVQYHGIAEDVKLREKIAGIVGEVDANVFANSKAVVQYSGYHIQIPLLAGINIYDDEDSAFYWAYGLNFSIASFVREVSGQQLITIATTNDPDAETTQEIDEEYHSVVNRDEVFFSPGLLTIMGARRRLEDNMFLYVEFRWHVGGSPDVQTSGTKREQDTKYASDTAPAIALETLFPGSVAQPLAGGSDPTGARTTNGLVLIYDMRLIFGLTFKH